jgi:hypothetical protein
MDKKFLVFGNLMMYFNDVFGFKCCKTITAYMFVVLWEKNISSP